MQTEKELKASDFQLKSSYAPVAQLDRASGFEPEGREFESLRARHPYRGSLTHDHQVGGTERRLASRARFPAPALRYAAASLPLPIPLNLLTQLPHVIQRPARLLRRPRQSRCRAVRIETSNTWRARGLLHHRHGRILRQPPHRLRIRVAERTRVDIVSNTVRPGIGFLGHLSPRSVNGRVKMAAENRSARTQPQCANQHKSHAPKETNTYSVSM